MRTRRFVETVTAGTLLLGLGYVVALAARQLPGGDDEPALVDVNLDMNIDLVGIFSMIILFVAAVFSLFLVANLARTQPGPPRRKRRWGMLVAAIAFLVIFRNLQPLVEEVVAGGSDLAAVEDDPETVAAVTASSWVVSALISLVVAATIARLGLLIRRAEPEFAPPEITTPAASPLGSAVVPEPVNLDGFGGRILSLYAQFESSSGEAGVPRIRHETAMRHAGRAVVQLGLPEEHVGVLAGLHGKARYSDQKIGRPDLEVAENAWQVLRRSFHL